MVGPSRRPGHTAPSAPHQSTPAAPGPPDAPATHRPPPPPAAVPQHSHPPPERPRRPRADVPPARTSPPAAKGSDVCALGRTYGGWRKGSPEAMICERTYGH